jgi:predicted dehydrogenase
MRPARVAVWGIGHHASTNILPAIAGVDGVELHGVCSRNANVVSGCMARWSCKGWTEPAAMLDDASVDVVYLATPTGLHAAQGLQALAAGKHLWCEKPLACTAAEALELVDVATERGASLCEAFMYLYHPQFEQLKRYLCGGTVGAVRSIACRFGIPTLERPSFRNDAALGGGALLDLACYPVSAVHALFPDEEAEVSHAGLENPRGSPVDTGGHAMIALSGGARAYLEWRTGCAYRNEIDMWGESGSISTQMIFSKAVDYVPEFRIRDLRGRERAESGSADNHFALMLRAFRATLDDPAAARRERSSIVRRAATLGMIRKRAGTR